MKPGLLILLLCLVSCDQRATEAPDAGKARALRPMVAIRDNQRQLGAAAPEPVSLDFSPDEQRVAVSYRDGFVRLWSVPTGELIAERKAHEGVATSVRFARDGRIVTSGTDGYCRLFDPMLQGEILRRSPGPDTAYACPAVPAPDASRFANGVGATLYIWDETGKTVREIDAEGSSHCAGLAWSHDGRLLASGDGRAEVRLFSVESGELAKNLGVAGTFVRFSADGRLFATWGFDQLRLFKVQEDLVLIHPFPFGDLESAAFKAGMDVTAVDFAPDGRRVIAGTATGTINVIDPEHPYERRRVRAHRGRVQAIACVKAADGLLVASAGPDGVFLTSVFIAK